jgi:hypothetical protein
MSGWRSVSLWIDRAERCGLILFDRTKKPRPAARCFCVEKVGRGCEKEASGYNREPGFFVIAVERVFSFRSDWHELDRARPLVRQYQIALDSVLRSHPRLQDCVTLCAHCGIRFLTHPRCAGRVDLRCPFGCRAHHRKQRSNQRSAAYYRTPSGKRMKKRLNARRSDDDQVAAGEVATAANEMPALAGERRTVDQPWDEPSPQVELQLEDLVLSESTLRTSPMLPYVGMIVNLLEGIHLRRHELLELLLQSLRQHSIAYRTRTDYVLRFLHQHPP